MKFRVRVNDSIFREFKQQKEKDTNSFNEFNWKFIPSLVSLSREVVADFAAKDSIFSISICFVR